MTTSIYAEVGSEAALISSIDDYTSKIRVYKFETF